MEKPMEKPVCLCGEEMVFLFDNKVRELWGCPSPTCDRVLLKQKKGTQGTFYRKETARLLNEPERPQAEETKIILISYSWWDKILEKILRKLYGF